MLNACIHSFIHILQVCVALTWSSEASTFWIHFGFFLILCSLISIYEFKRRGQFIKLFFLLVDKLLELEMVSNQNKVRTF